jgi:hypothetical protein
MHVAGFGLPLFSSSASGIIFRPGITRIFCAKSTDSAGTCKGYQGW